MPAGAPLAGIFVVDATRMIPGAVLARCLLDLGAELVKVEDPAGGDPLRHTPPVIDGIGMGFRVHYRGARSVTLDLRTPTGAAGLRRLIGRADVFCESFRPGTLEGWGIDGAALRRDHPRLVTCALPSFGSEPGPVAHDLNVLGASGLTGRLGTDPDGAPIVPRVQIADVTTGLLAAGAVLGALLARERHGQGAALVQPLVAAPLALLAWPLADAAVGGPSIHDGLLGGEVPCYGHYRCADGTWLAVACLEPKFWVALCTALALPELSGQGFLAGAAGRAVRERVGARLAERSRADWLDALAPGRLPVSPVDDLAPAARNLARACPQLFEDLALPDGATARIPGPAMPSLGHTPAGEAPRLGADDGWLEALGP
jgi:crotonobetainyl-CoA:carnitine CoA-transferase CaiB-like acyl-CoA transferase